MELVFWQHINGALQRDPMTLDQVFAWNIRFQIFCRNQDEKDLLSAYQLIYGREVQVDVYKEWMNSRGPHEVDIGGHKYMMAGKSPLPFTFTTWPDANLRGL